MSSKWVTSKRGRTQGGNSGFERSRPHRGAECPVRSSDADTQTKRCKKRREDSGEKAAAVGWGHGSAPHGPRPPVPEPRARPRFRGPNQSEDVLQRAISHEGQLYFKLSSLSASKPEMLYHSRKFITIIPIWAIDKLHPPPPSVGPGRGTPNRPKTFRKPPGEGANHNSCAFASKRKGGQVKQVEESLPRVVGGPNRRKDNQPEEGPTAWGGSLSGQL